MQRSSPLRPFLFGALGMVVAVLLALLLEAVLGGDPEVSEVLFVAAAILTPVVGLGVLLQVVGALAGRTRGLLRELKRFQEEMAADPPELGEESQRERRAVWEKVSGFVHVLRPFAAGVALQLIVTETVAVYCIAADVDERVVGLAVGIEVFVLFNYLIFFGVLLERLAGRGRRAAAA